MEPRVKDTYPYYLANEPVAVNADLEVLDKYSGKVAARVALADATAVDAAIAAAHAARTAMAAFPPDARRDVLEHCMRRFGERSEELALALCIEQGQLRRHAERIRTRLDAARARSVKLALGAGCTFAAEPVGLFGWVETGVDTDALSQRMLDEGYLLAPGALFHAERKPSTLMRINFATTQEAAFWKTFARVRDEQMR